MSHYCAQSVTASTFIYPTKYNDIMLTESNNCIKWMTNGHRDSNQIARPTLTLILDFYLLRILRMFHIHVLQDQIHSAQNTDQGYQQVPCKFTLPTWYFIYWSDIVSFGIETSTYVCINHFLMMNLINFVKALPQLPRPTTTTMIIINNIIIMRSPHEPQLGYPLLSNVAGLICFSAVGGGCVRLISINDDHHHCPR